MVAGEAFLSAFLQVLFDRLASKHFLNFIRGRDVENDLKKLKKTLSKVKVVLNDAEDKQFKNEAVKMWVEELKDAAYDAEDLLDEFATEALGQKLEAESQSFSSNQVWSLLSTSINPNNHFFSVRIESKIKEITERFDELANERFELGLEEVAAGSSSIVRETSSVVDESVVFGRDDDKEKIVELLLKEEPKISVIPIVGMGGIGKTTVAQIVYNSDKVEKHFDLKAWVCVSKEFDVMRITKSILKLVTSEACDFDDLNQVQVKVKKALARKKFLIVLDDVWSKRYGDWDVLQNPFRAGAPGSKIIVTTRNRDVALMMGTVHSHYLDHLSNDDSWLVFVQHAFGNRNVPTRSNLAVIGKKIVEKCEGLPLAAKALGGLLRSKLDEDEWEDVLNSKIWEFSENETDILPALKLSYHHLPSHLKRCFAYCAILPKDYEFEELELVRLWIAEGLVSQPNGRKQIEDLAVNYFRDLLSRSFFQPSSSNKSVFVMHDLMNDLAQWVAGETCFKLEDELEVKRQHKISKKTRHFSYVGSCYDGVKKFEAFDEVDCLRTFISLKTPKWSYLTNSVPLNLLPKLRSLRVLSLGGYHITELPSSIGDLKHLRYLNLSSTKIRSLPESTNALYNLQTLILKDCYYLKKLPKRMGNLINLRHLDITNVYLIKEMPLQVGKLTSLQNLSNFIVGNDSGVGIRELAKINGLQGILCISNLENVIDARDARAANLNDKQGLDVLVMEWSRNFDGSRIQRVEEDVLDMLQPSKMLKELTIKCYGGARFPMWIGDSSFSSMVFLRLENCESCTSLPPLGQLPSLRDLCIMGMNKVSGVSLEFYGVGCRKPFPSLETLCFADMQEWKDWFSSAVDGWVEAFPCLRELSIERCPKLSGKLPGHLPSLEKLIIYECQLLVVSISSLPKLCKLDIQECGEVVHRSVDGLSSLKSMSLCNISKFMRLTEGFMRGLTQVEDLVIVGSRELTSLWQNGAGLLQHLTSLSCLTIEGCPKLVSLVTEEEEEELKKLGLPCRLESLVLYRCVNLENLQGLHNLTSLRKLTIEGCPTLESFPETGLPPMLRELMIQHCSGLKSLPGALLHSRKYASLEHLRIERCYFLSSISRGQLPSTVKKLEIVCCENLQSLVDEEGCTFLHKKTNNGSESLLEVLFIYKCPSLKFILSTGELPATLKYLHVERCPKLESLVESVHNNTALESIRIWDCENLKSLPDGLNNLSPIPVAGGSTATNLRELWICNSKKLKALPSNMHNPTSLQKLKIIGCPGIASFPQELGSLSNLTSLCIYDLNVCTQLFKLGLHKLISLRELEIAGGCPDLVSFPEKEEQEQEEKGMMLPTSLISLHMRDFPNLKYLSSMGFQNLTSLEDLWINSCPKLKSFPEEGLPPSLLQLRICDCPLLKRRCKKNQGQDWPKIAHIPCVYIDRRFIFDPEDLELEEF